MIIRLKGFKPIKTACQQCDMTFKYSDSLDKHMRTHSGENPFNFNEIQIFHKYSKIALLVRENV